MSKVYIAAAFRKHTDRTDKSKAYGVLEDNFHLDFLEKIEDIFLNYGFDCCLPHRDEGDWGKIYFDPAPLSALCLRHVETSDIIFAIAEESRGVHIELGYASAFPNKKIIVLFHKDKEPSTLIWGLSNDYTPWKIKSNYGKLIIDSYTNEEDLFRKVENILANKLKLKKLKNNKSRRTIGIIDIGSHTLKLRIYSGSEGTSANILYKENASLGIINEVLSNNIFSENIIIDLINQLTIWKEKCITFRCEDIILTGTAAFRNAKNTDYLVSKINSEVGLKIQLLNAEAELDLLYNGVASSMRTKNKFGVLGLGGGSTQIGVGDNKTAKNKYFLDFGTNLISKKWSWSKPFTKFEYNTIIHFVEEKFDKQIPFLNDKIDHIVYTGGETEFMLKCHLPLTTFNSSSIHVSQIDIESFKQFCFQFANLHPHEVFERFHLDPKWAIGAIAANTIALVVAQKFSVQYIIPSNFNISEGLILAAK